MHNINILLGIIVQGLPGYRREVLYRNPEQQRVGSLPAILELYELYSIDDYKKGFPFNLYKMIDVEPEIVVTSELVELIDSEAELADLLELDDSELKELPEKEVELRRADTKKREPLNPVERQVYEECGRCLQSLTSLTNTLEKVQYRPSLTAAQKLHLEQHSKIFKILEAQTLMVLYILEHQHLDSFEKDFDSNFDVLGKFRIRPDVLKSKAVNFRMVGKLHEREEGYIANYGSVLKRLAEESLTAGQLKYLVDSLQLTAYKLHALSVIYPSSLSVPLDDLFNEEPSSARWRRLQENITYANSATKEEIDCGFRFTRDRVVFMQAVTGLIHELQNQEEGQSSGVFGSLLKGGAKLLKYAFSDEKATRKADKFKLSPNASLVRNMFEFDKNVVTRTAMQAALPSMSYSKLISIPRHFKSIDAELVLGWAAQQDYSIEATPLSYDDQLREPLQSYTERMFAENTDQDKRISIRVNCAFKLKTLYEKPKSILEHFFKRPIEENVEALALHIHGGGFICQNTFLHQTYIRRWASRLRIPFFSVEYRKSPQWGYPAALDDSFQTYMWLIALFDQVFEAKPPKILLVGDSAGGNLATGVTALAVKFRVRIPDALALVYPAFDLSTETFSPSRLVSLDDYLLPTSVLRLCQESYLPGEEFSPKRDAFISPILLTDELLKQFPRVAMFVGNADPLHDEAMRFLERMVNLKKRIHLTVYDGFPHGFLQFDLPVRQMKFLRRVVEEIGDQIGELVGVSPSQ